MRPIAAIAAMIITRICGDCDATNNFGRNACADRTHGEALGSNPEQVVDDIVKRSEQELIAHRPTSVAIGLYGGRAAVGCGHNAAAFAAKAAARRAQQRLQGI